MKQLLALGVASGLIVFGAVIYSGVQLLANSYLDQATAGSASSSCGGPQQNHQVVIQDNTVTPVYSYAFVCDTLTITNTDDKLREIGFGEHEHHQAYDGITEKTLDKNKSLTITLRKAGIYKFHDHFQTQVRGKFVVAN